MFSFGLVLYQKTIPISMFHVLTDCSVRTASKADGRLVCAPDFLCISLLWQTATSDHRIIDLEAPDRYGCRTCKTKISESNASAGVPGFPRFAIILQWNIMESSKMT